MFKRIFILLTILLVVTLVNAFSSDIRELDPSEVTKRDAHLLESFNNLEIELDHPAIVSIKFRKIRGYQVGGSTWDNEKWSYVITVQNDSDSVKKLSADLTFYDAEGFKLDDSFVYVTNINPHEIKKISDNFFLSLNYINKITSVKLIGEGLH